MAKLLIFDDSIEVLATLQLVFKLKGYISKTVDNRTAFFEEVQNKPDLIILDVLLKDGDGRRICRQLKEDSTTKNIPIILISGNPGLLESYKSYHADAILEKPFDMPTLIRKVEGLLGD